MARPIIDTESVAQDQLRAFFERWQRLEEEKRAISDDLKELFAEAKAFGFHTKVMRKLFRDETGDHAERMEFEAVYELYAAALGTRNANARDAREDDDSDDANSTARETLASTTAADPAAEADDASSADQSTAALTEVPGTAPDHQDLRDIADAPRSYPPEPQQKAAEHASSGSVAGAPAGTQAPPVDTHSDAVQPDPVRNDGKLASGVGTAGEASAPAFSAAPIHEPGKGALGESPSMAPEPATEEGTTSPQPSSVVPGRQPGCLNPDTCAGTWRKRCASCERAFMAVASGGQAIVHQGQVA